MKKLCFILRTNFATRRTLVRLRVTKIKSEALILLSLSVLHLFSIPLKKGCKKTWLEFFYSLFSGDRKKCSRMDKPKPVSVRVYGSGEVCSEPKTYDLFEKTHF